MRRTPGPWTCAKMGLFEFASVCLVFGSRSEKRRNGERSNGHSQEQDERHHQGSPLVFAALPGEYRGMLNQGTDERLGAQRESLWRFPGVSRESETKKAPPEPGSFKMPATAGGAEAPLGAGQLASWR